MPAFHQALSWLLKIQLLSSGHALFARQNTIAFHQGLQCLLRKLQSHFVRACTVLLAIKIQPKNIQSNFIRACTVCEEKYNRISSGPALFAMKKHSHFIRACIVCDKKYNHISSGPALFAMKNTISFQQSLHCLL